MKQRPVLSRRQAQVYAMVVAGVEAGNCPSYREIGQALGISKPTVFEYLSKIIKHGYLAKERRRSRSLTIVKPIDARYADSEARRLQSNAHKLLAYVQDAATTGCVEAQALVETITGKAGAS